MKGKFSLPVSTAALNFYEEKVAILWDIAYELMFRRNVSLPSSGSKISRSRNQPDIRWRGTTLAVPQKMATFISTSVEA
jgi:hypothetical protein